MRKSNMKNSFYVFPFLLYVSCIAMVLALLCLVGMFVLGDISSESLALTIICTILIILIPSISLFISIFFMMNKIEITKTSFQRKSFGKITKEVAYKDIVDCGCIDANFNFQSEETKSGKIGMFCAWCYILDEEMVHKNIEQLRMTRKRICFKLTPKRKEIIMNHCPNEEVKNRLFENVEF